ncbi:DUF3829 domain-containing protein [Aureibaculum sp. A20]|uniref:DUF3829 domain-containing protein n=1 Tax=Aureibaculum flavum TaxID=2795986 RepID=A0ABS0WUR3_9FLAO|nr:DUF3829 domain-containing protein [Aureibaculum flavum]MBJ2175719.1 DUF3829 domain-containing protein [Aureibaculum flavum]
MTLKRIIVLSLFSIVFYACNNNADENLSNQVNSISIKKPSAYDQKLIKIASIDKSFANYSVRAFEVYNDYVSLFGSNPDKMELDKIVNFSQIDDSQIHSLKLLDSAITLPVLKELNPLIRSYKINARAFAVTINSCKSYFTKKEYKKDKYDQAVVLHKLTIDIYSKFKKADSILRIKSKKIAKSLENEYLYSLNEAGLEVEYLAIVGKKDVDNLNTLLSSSTYNDLKVEKLASLHNKIETTFNKLTELKQSDLKQFNHNTTVYYSNLEQLNHSFNELIQRKNDKKKFSKDELKKLNENKIAASSVNGSIEAVLLSCEKLTDSFKDYKSDKAYTNPIIASTKNKIANSVKIPSAIK